MELIADGLVFLGALVASVYCIVLSRRLRRMSMLEDGVGQAITSLSSQVEEMRTALAEAKISTETAGADVDARVGKAVKAAERLEQLTRSAERRSDIIETLLGRAARLAEPAAPGVKATEEASSESVKSSIEEKTGRDDETAPEASTPSATDL